MSNFKQEDYEKIQKWGNEKAYDYWMAGHNKTLYPIPERRDLTKMKEFMRMKYVQKRFMEEEDNSDSDSGSDDSEQEKKSKKKTKQKKKPKKTKKSKKKKKQVTSSDDSDESESEEEVKEEKVPKKKTEFKKAPKSKVSSKLGKPKATVKKEKPKVAEKPKEDLMDILDMGLDTTPSQPAEAPAEGGWANFENGSKTETTDNKENNNDLWGAFSQPTQPTQPKKSADDLVNNLGDLYGQAAAQQQHNANPFGSFGMGNMPQTQQIPPNNFTMPTQPQPQAQCKFQI